MPDAETGQAFGRPSGLAGGYSMREGTVKAQAPSAERLDSDHPPAPIEPSGYDRALEAAIALFAARGFSGAGIRDVAERAGMVSASLYHWFDNKEALLLAIMRRGQTRLNDCANAAVAPLRSPEARA